MARLSVNLNKIALLRNSRRTGAPDLLAFPKIVRDAGALGVTVHPRPDERHIRRSDVGAIADVIAPWRPAFEFNIEGRPDDAFLALVETVKPEQCTLVPDADDAFTSEEGWRLDEGEIARLAPVIARLHRMGARVILFVDPDPAIVERVAKTRADGIEIYTGSYAAAFRDGAGDAVLGLIRELGAKAHARGLVVNAGHDLNLKNIPPLVAALPHLHEASIGHELTADALIHGFPATVAAYAKALAPA
ncbi:MAG: pyridoxine 5'-phosphate synthase [Rhizobiales bacterium 65-9]|nr:pyridoxine 5'-phosphate synthase [Hyphomicrobiales bacterium]OJY37997.1 MAG: pyridoxine 5'-phosphate synthase [Rhizobiales bacterium 65-9]